MSILYSNDGPTEITLTDFKGFRDDRGKKFVTPEYFFGVQNINYDDIIGANQILAPTNIYTNGGTSPNDGIYEYKYTDSNDQVITEAITVINGTIYKNFNSNPSVIASGLSPGRCDFATFNNTLCIVNGINYPKFYDGTAVWEMGAPKAVISYIPGVLTGAYYYAVTYVTSGGEEVLGTISSIVNPILSQVTLTLPIGYDGTLSRKIYRTEAGGNQLKLLTTIADNDTVTYYDNIADGSLTTDIPTTNVECIKPYFIEVAYSSLILCKASSSPTQTWVGDPNVYVVDPATPVEISGVGNDYSPLEGIEQDYSMIIIGSQKNIYTLDITGTTPQVTLTRANVGVKDGYSMTKVPAQGDFPGGVMFLSNVNDIRLFNGNFAQPVATSLDNLATNNWSQPIKTTLDYLLGLSNRVYAMYFDYKYHISIGKFILIFDIRTSAWGKYLIETESYSASYNVFGVVGGNLYGGLYSNGNIEKFYSSLTYKGESLPSTITGPQLFVSEEEKYFKSIYFYFVPTSDADVTVEIILDGDTDAPISRTLELRSGAFASEFFLSPDFSVNKDFEDYRVLHINRWARWISYNFITTKGRFFFRGIKIVYDRVANKEG